MMKRPNSRSTILTSCTCAVVFLTCIQVMSIMKSQWHNRDLSAAMAPEHQSADGDAERQKQQRRNLRPLQIHKEIDDYVSNVLPEPDLGLSKIYAKSLPMPNNFGDDDNNSISMITTGDEAPLPLLNTTTEQRYVIITFANTEYFENKLISNWMCSLHALDVHNFVVIPIDAAAAKAAQERVDKAILPEDSIYWDPAYWTVDPNSVKKKSKGFSGQLRKGTKPTKIFIEFIWRRAQLVRTLMSRYPDLNVILTDADTTWATKPWEANPTFFNQTNECDMFFTNDIDNGQEELPIRTVEPLSGFIMIRNRDVVLRLYHEWIKAALVFHNKDQPSMRAAIQTFKFKYLVGPSEYDQPREKPGQLLMCTLDRDRFPTIHYIEDGKYAERFNNNTDAITLWHPNFGEKWRKPLFFMEHNQWYLDSSNTTCVVPTTHPTQQQQQQQPSTLPTLPTSASSFQNSPAGHEETTTTTTTTLPTSSS